MICSLSLQKSLIVFSIVSYQQDAVSVSENEKQETELTLLALVNVDDIGVF